MNKKINKLILLFLIIQPFIDVITSLQIRYDLGFTISSILRGIFFTFILFYLIKNKINKKVVILFLIYFFLAMSYYFLYTKNNLLVEFSNILKIFYLPFLIHFFNNYNEEKINDKFITVIYLIYLNLVIIPYIFGFGFDIYKNFEHKSGFIGLFYSGNELSAIILGLMPIVFNYAFNSKNYILKILIYLETLIVTLLVGTKTLSIGIIIVFIYFFIKYLKSNEKIKNKIILIVLFIVMSLTVIISFSKLNVVNNFKVTLNYYKINSVSDISVKNIDNLIFSKRLSNLQKINKEYLKSNYRKYFYGLGLDKINNIKDIEIDIFDLFYSVGIFGTIIYLISLYQKSKLKNYYKFSLILFILISFFTGHVIIEPMVSIYISLLFILNKNNKENGKKRILLVSNMYPNEKYKHFGVFVKNTNDLLIENNYFVDKVVKYKETKFFDKLFSYIIFGIKATLKGIFNNYDYIYVHYISHSTMGVLLPILTSKNTKLILNAHGTDLVADFDYEKKNEKRSKFFLKFAYKVVVPSKYFKSVLIENYNYDENKICVYPSGGVNTEKFVKKDKDEAKKRASLSDKYNYIGYISRIDKDKGYDIFLKAIKELEKENKLENKKFLIVGAGSEEIKMQNLIKELGILKYLEIRNMVSQEELVDIYNSLDIFIFPTYRKSESLGLVGLEAMSCEKIVIASKNYGPTDYIVNKKNGLFFNPKDPIDLKNKIIYAENLNNEEYNRMVKKARETAIKYDVKNTKNLILDVFKEDK